MTPDFRTASFQDIFNFVYAKVVEQGRPSGAVMKRKLPHGESVEEFACQYRGPYGTKCAFGHLVSDEEIANAGSQWTDNLTVRSAWSVLDNFTYGELEVKYGQERLDFLRRLQCDHDIAATDSSRNFGEFVDLYKEASEKTAVRYNLKFPV